MIDGVQWRVYDNAGDTVCHVETEHDAVLISAAPELSAVLRDLVLLARDPDASDLDADALLADAEALLSRIGVER
jgi:hypothetical protein